MPTPPPADDRSGLLDAPTARVAACIARERLASVVDAREALERGEADALHDFRVALRRLRSWLRAYRPWIGDTLRKRTTRALRDIADATSAARDAEVAAAGMLGGHSEAMATELRDDAARARRRLDRLLRRRFARANARAEADLRAADEASDAASDACARVASMRVVTARLVHEHVDAIRDSLDAVDASLDPTTLHRVRIEAKRLRYLLEPLSDAAPGANDLVATLASWQDALGELHDAHLLGEHIAARRARRAARRARRARERASEAASLGDAAIDRAGASVAARLETARERVRTLLWDGRASVVLHRADELADAIARRDDAVTPRVQR